MPRKATNKGKPPLHFLERPVGGARLKNVPDVRAATNPREFFSEEEEHNNSSHNSWVSPQFDTSLVAALPVRRGRRRCQSATSILDTCSQLSRKRSVCRYPSLTFESRREQPRQPKRPPRKNASTAPVGNQPAGPRQTKSAGNSTTHQDTPKRQTVSLRKKTAKTYSDASSSRSADVSPPLPAKGQCRTPAPAPASDELSTTDVGSVRTPPDVDTPKATGEGSSCPSPPHVHWLLALPCTPPQSRPPDVLAADTPERDYGLKVTWRRRRGLMMLLKQRGHLRDSQVLVDS